MDIAAFLERLFDANMFRRASGRAESRWVEGANMSFVGASVPIVTGMTVILVGDPC